MALIRMEITDDQYERLHELSMRQGRSIEETARDVFIAAALTKKETTTTKAQELHKIAESVLATKKEASYSSLFSCLNNRALEGETKWWFRPAEVLPYADRLRADGFDVHEGFGVGGDKVIFVSW